MAFAPSLMISLGLNSHLFIMVEKKGMLTLSAIGIIFRAVTTCLIIWLEHNPPDAPP